jgi:hypothetical protein
MSNQLLLKSSNTSLLSCCAGGGLLIFGIYNIPIKNNKNIKSLMIDIILFSIGKIIINLIVCGTKQQYNLGSNVLYRLFAIYSVPMYYTIKSITHVRSIIDNR